MRYAHSLEIAAPIRQVFDLVAQPEKLPLWMTGLAEMVYTSQAQGRVGATFVHRMRRGRAEFRGKVTAYEKPHRFAFRVGNSAFSAEVEYLLEPLGDGTRLGYTLDVINRTRLTQLNEVLMGASTRRLARKQLKRLKKVAERAA